MKILDAFSPAEGIFAQGLSLELLCKQFLGYYLAGGPRPNLS